MLLPSAVLDDGKFLTRRVRFPYDLQSSFLVAPMFHLVVKDVQHKTETKAQMLSAAFSTLTGRKRVWFRTGPGPVNTTIEPFFPVALIPAMRRNWRLSMEGEISPLLMKGGREIQRIMSGWYPDFHRVRMDSGLSGLEAASGTGSVAAFFSGGVDSFFTLQQHLGTITHLIFVHGFDVPLGDEMQRRRMARNAASVAEQLGLTLVEVETNLRDFGDRHVSWPDAYFGAGLGAIALLLSPRFERIYLPASVSYGQLIPMGSHPDLDHLWSNGGIRIIHDGAEYDRFDKIKSVSGWPIVADHLRICYQRGLSGLNCGACRKCLWTMMVLEAIGKLGEFSTLPDEIDLQAIQQYPPHDAHQRDRMLKSIEYLGRRSRNEPLSSILRDLVEGADDPQSASRETRSWRKIFKILYKKKR
jgi:hypothetical protein